MPITINQIKEMKEKGEKITMLTTYDYSMARIVDKAYREYREVWR